MPKHHLIALAALTALSACGEGSSPQNATTRATAPDTPSPKDRLAEINAAYSANGLQARRKWGGKRVTIGGAFYSAGRNGDGSTSILINPGDMPATLGELNVGKGQDDFVAGLKKDQEVVMTCTVDPRSEGFTTAFVDCVPVNS